MSKDISASKRYAWFKDQYQNPKEFSYSFKEILTWFKDNNIDYLSSIPFNNINENIKLFEKNPMPSNYKLKIKEFLMTFDISQIKEGGFFIMIGKKL